MIRVRPAGAADLPEMMAMASSADTASQWTRSQYEQSLSSGRLVLVIEADREAAGFMVGRGVDSEWEIENLVIAEKARRCGLGSLLLAEFLRRVRSAGGREIFLEVRESNLGARALYRKWNFAETGKRPEYYKSPVENALLLRLRFPHPPDEIG